VLGDERNKLVGSHSSWRDSPDETSRLSFLGSPGVAQRPDGAGKVLGDNVADGVGNGWAEIQPGELVHRHPLPAGQYWVTAVQARLRLLPYLHLIDQIDHVPVGRQRFADDHQPADARLESQLLVELPLKRRVQRLVAL